ncbi:MAG: hypothetical protein VCD00_03885 [Candidatus Hydrogenedentota bacterium]
MKKSILLACVLSAMTIPSQADTIVVDGKTYTDVLVYESSRYYFVKLPREGRSISVAKGKVDAATIQLNDDPFYRDDLRELYDDVKLRGEDALGDRAVNDSAFQVEEGIDRVIDTGALLSGAAGGGGKPMNLTVDDAKAALAALQITFTKSGNAWTGKSADGIVTVSLATSGNAVTVLSGNVNDPTAVQTKAPGIIQMLQKVAPWAGPWVFSNIQVLQTGGTLHKAQDGVDIMIQTSEAGMSFTVKGV